MCDICLSQVQTKLAISLFITKPLMFPIIIWIILTTHQSLAQFKKEIHHFYFSILSQLSLLASIFLAISLCLLKIRY